MQQLAVQATGAPVPFIAGYGTTETGPGISSTHWASEGRGEIGLPFAGCEIKLVPFGDRFDLRARGPNVFPGYLGRPDLTAEAFDEEGFYKVGDAAQFVDPTDPSQGLRFAGRLSESFKLSNGTWVLTRELRLAVIAAVPSIAEAVVAGHDRDDIRLLVWAKGDAADLAETLRAGFEAYNANNKISTRRIAAFLVVKDPPSMAAGEITDKGYVNQRAVLTNRNCLVEDLYSQAQSVVMCRS